jgi:hypothetical protein
MKPSRCWAALLLFAGGSAAAETLPAGEPVDEALVIDLTPAGFDALTGVLPSLLPSGVSIDPIGDGYEGLFGECWLGGYEYGLSNLWIDLSVGSASLVPRDGYLSIDLDINIAINDPGDTFALYTMLECIEDTCDGHVEPFTVSASTIVDLQVVTGADGLPAIEANVGDVAVDYTLSGSQIHLDNCAIGTVEDVLNFFGLSLYDIILSFAGGFIDDAVSGFVPEIEALIEDATSSVYIEQEIDLGGAVADLVIYPHEVRIREEGLRIAMAGLMDAAAPADCIAPYDVGGSYYFASDTPGIGAGPAGHHAGIFLSDEFGNQALYAIWRAGLLCQVVDSELTGGINLDTNLLLGILAGDAFKELFPEPRTMVILTRPVQPPELAFGTENDIGVSVQQLGLDFYAELDHRQSRTIGVDLNADIGVNLPFDATTGQLALDLDLAGENFDAMVTHNDFVPSADGDIEAALPGMVDTLVGPAVSGMLGETTFALPAIEGLGLTGMDVDAAGTDGDWLGLYASVGPVSYEAAGCDESGGGCDLGCGAVGPSPGRLALFALPLMVIVLRRRQDPDGNS